MPKKTIYLRADGSATIGLGHLVRCIALAQMLREEYNICFISIDAPKNIVHEFEKNGFSYVNIKHEREFLSMLIPDNIVILDHYDIDSNYQKEIKNKGCKLVCIDDLHDKVFYADLIINHGPGVKESMYNAQSYTKFALGLDYVLLRSEFLNATKVERKLSKIDTAFICFGGADPLNLSERCLKVITKFKKLKRIIVVIGAANCNHINLKQYKEQCEIDLFTSLNAKEIIGLMNQSDVAIVPSSSILLEAFSVGLPSITGYYVLNQKETSVNVCEMNLAISCGSFLENFEFNLEVALSTLTLDIANNMIYNQKKNLTDSKDRYLEVFNKL